MREGEAFLFPRRLSNFLEPRTVTSGGSSRSRKFDGLHQKSYFEHLEAYPEECWKAESCEGCAHLKECLERVHKDG